MPKILHRLVELPHGDELVVGHPSTYYRCIYPLVKKILQVSFDSYGNLWAVDTQGQLWQQHRPWLKYE